MDSTFPESSTSSTTVTTRVVRVVVRVVVLQRTGQAQCLHQTSHSEKHHHSSSSASPLSVSIQQPAVFCDLQLQSGLQVQELLEADLLLA